MRHATETFDFLHDRRRLLAIILMSLAGTAVVVFLVARGELAGADARAYWGGVRVWLDGGSPMAPPTPYLPYVYAPWTVPIFLPWALLPWDVAWFVWRGLNVLLLLWSASWAYQRHPLATATVLCALGIWAAQFVGPRLGGGLWALATVLKWFPAPLWLILPARARLWGLIWMSLALLLALATWPQTLAQMQAAIAFPRPFRLDYLLLLWACVPWVWARPRLLDPTEWRPLGREIAASARTQWADVRSDERPARAAFAWLGLHTRSALGITASSASEPLVAPTPPAPTPPAPVG